jgi:hypothetical protein
MSRTTRLQAEALEARDVPTVVYALTQSQRLQAFDSSNPVALLGAVTLRGAVDPGETITDIDVRPVTGQLYGRSSAGRIYVIDVPTGLMAPLPGQFAVGAVAPIDFDPTTDLIRVTNFSGANIAINPNDGSLASIGAVLNYVPGDLATGFIPRLGGLAFTNSFPFATFTQRYGIDYIRDTLVTGINSPDTGTFSTVGPLGFDVTNAIGFDFDPATNVAFATFQLAGTNASIFGRVATNTGAFIPIAPVGTSGATIRGMAVARSLGNLGIPLPPPLLAPTVNPVFVAPGTGVGTIPPLFTPSVTSPNLIPPLVTTVPTNPLSSTLVQPLAPGLVGTNLGTSFVVTNNTFTAGFTPTSFGFTSTGIGFTSGTGFGF